MRRFLLPVLLCMALFVFYVCTNGNENKNDLYYDNFVQREVINVSITKDYNAVTEDAFSQTIGSDSESNRLKLASIVGFFSNAVPMRSAPSKDFSIASDCKYFFTFKFNGNYPNAEFYYSKDYHCIVEKVIYDGNDIEVVDFKYYKVDENFDKFMNIYNSVQVHNDFIM